MILIVNLRSWELIESNFNSRWVFFLLDFKNRFLETFYIKHHTICKNGSYFFLSDICNFSFFIALVQTYHVEWDSDSNCSCFVIKGKYFSSVKNNFRCRFLASTLQYVKKFLSLSVLLSYFVMKRSWILSHIVFL